MTASNMSSPSFLLPSPVISRSRPSSATCSRHRIVCLSSTPTPLSPFSTPPFTPLPSLPPSLFWFRRDLRLCDHPALLFALNHSSPLPVFIHTPPAPSRLGHYPPGTPCPNLLNKSLQHLRHLLSRYNSSLVLREGLPELQLPLLARSVNARVVYTQVDPSFPSEQLHRVKQALASINVRLHCLPGGTLIPSHLLSSPLPYHQFHNAAVQLDIPQPLPPPSQFPTPPSSPIPLWPSDFPMEPSSPLEKHLSDCLCDLVSGNLSIHHLQDYLQLGLLTPRSIFYRLPASDIPQQTVSDLIWRDFLYRASLRSANRRLQLEESSSPSTSPSPVLPLLLSP